MFNVCTMLQIKGATNDQGHFLMKAIAKRGSTKWLKKRPVIERLLLSECTNNDILKYLIIANMLNCFHIFPLLKSVNPFRYYKEFSGENPFENLKKVLT